MSQKIKIKYKITLIWEMKFSIRAAARQKYLAGGGGGGGWSNVLNFSKFGPKLKRNSFCPVLLTFSKN